MFLTVYCLYARKGAVHAAVVRSVAAASTLTAVNLDNGGSSACSNNDLPTMRIWAKAWRGSFSTCVDIVSARAPAKGVASCSCSEALTRSLIKTSGNKSCAKLYQYQHANVVWLHPFPSVRPSWPWRLCLAPSFEKRDGISNIFYSRGGRNVESCRGVKLALGRHVPPFPSSVDKIQQILTPLDGEESLQTEDNRENKRQQHCS